MKNNLHENARAWRHDIHKHPELGFRENRTAGLIADLLTEFGLEVHAGIGKTGIVGVLKRGDSADAIGLRADIDALPIQEANTFDHRSVHDGVFHGCGHDGHTAMLLAAAKQLSESGRFDGTVYFIFQPSEEDGRGALAMIDDGLFDRFAMKAVYGMHNMPGIPAGHFAVRKGVIMTSEDIFVITIRGRGGHASMPDRAIDPLVIAAEVIFALQSIVSRSVGPQDWGVVSATELLTDGARNVIPSTVTIKGDCRAMSTETQALMESRMREIVAGITAAHGADGTVEYRNDFVITVNTPAETDAAVAAARKVAGEPAVDADCPPCSASEDFARMLQEKPGCYILIGNGLDGHCGATLHNPDYDLNDEILTVGANYWVTLVEDQLPAKRVPGELTVTEASSKSCPMTALSELYELSNPQLEQTLSRARAEEPVTYLPDIGYWAVSKYEDVKRILGDTENFSAEITLQPLEPFTEDVVELLKTRKFTPRPTLSNNTRDDHPRIRRHTQIAFAPRRMKTLEPYIRQLVNDAVDSFIDDGRADLVAQLVYELPALVLFKLIGVPPEDVAHIKQWADDRLLLTFGRLDGKRQLEAAKNLADYWDYCLALVQKKMQEPGDDLPSDMLATRAEDEAALSIEDINNVVFGLLLAGHETTTNASANAILTLLQERGAWAELAANPDLIPGAIEEILRFRPSVVAWRRLARKPVEVSGVSIPAGDRVLCFLASANRDEDKFDNSEVFDLHRKDSRAHIAFGFGNHFCLGAPLARFELQLILEELMKRLPNLHLVDDQSLAMVETVQFRGPKELWVEW